MVGMANPPTAAEQVYHDSGEYKTRWGSDGFSQ